jgi:hypothetical protein
VKHRPRNSKHTSHPRMRCGSLLGFYFRRPELLSAAAHPRARRFSRSALTAPRALSARPLILPSSYSCPCAPVSNRTLPRVSHPSGAPFLFPSLTETGTHEGALQGLAARSVPLWAVLVAAGGRKEPASTRWDFP